MSLVTKKAVAAKAKEITAEELFLSAEFHANMSRSMKALVRRNRSMRLPALLLQDMGQDGPAAFTDGRRVTVNVATSMLNEKGVQTMVDKADILRGLAFHEVMHVLYTNFSLLKTRMEGLRKGQVNCPSEWTRRLLPADRQTGEAYFAQLNAKLQDAAFRNAFAQACQRIDNCVEDGFIEERGMEVFAGEMVEGLYFLREIQYDSFACLDDRLNELKATCEEDPQQWISLLVEITLSYSKYGLISYKDPALRHHPLIQRFASVAPYLNGALQSPRSRERAEWVNAFLLMLFPELSAFCEQIGEQDDEPVEIHLPASALSSLNEGASGAPMDDGRMVEIVGGKNPKQSEPSQTPQSKQRKAALRIILDDDNEEKEDTRSQADPSAAPSGSQSEQNQDGQSGAQESSSDADGSSGEAGRDSSEKEGAAGQKTEEDSDNAQTQPEKSRCQPDASAKQSGSQGSDEGSVKDGEDGHGLSLSSNADFDASEDLLNLRSEEGGRIALGEGSALEAEGSGLTDRCDGNYRSADGYDIQQILMDIAQRQVEEAAESERVQTLNQQLEGMNLGHLHRRIDVRIERQTVVDQEQKERYEEFSAPLVPIGKKAANRLKALLQKQRKGGRDRNLINGHRLDSRSFYRQDGRNFERRRLPRKTDVCFGVLIDESGSMSYGNREGAARAAAIVLYELCEQLDLPVMIYGHTAWNSMTLYSYAEFDKADKNDRYRLMNTNAREANRDGAAMSYLYQRLSARPEQTKVLLIISDGQPNAFGYDGLAAEEDMRTLCDSYGRKGIVTIAANIGDDFESLERIYGKRVLNFADLDKVPEVLARHFARFIKAQ